MAHQGQPLLRRRPFGQERQLLAVLAVDSLRPRLDRRVVEIAAHLHGVVEPLLDLRRAVVVLERQLGGTEPLAERAQLTQRVLQLAAEHALAGLVGRLVEVDDRLHEAIRQPAQRLVADPLALVARGWMLGGWRP